MQVPEYARSKVVVIVPIAARATVSPDLIASFKDYDFRKMTMGSFGYMCHDQYLDYKIHLHGYAARYTKNRIWGENQKIVRDEKKPGLLNQKNYLMIGMKKDADALLKIIGV